jgi:hypothetical protein
MPVGNTPRGVCRNVDYKVLRASTGSLSPLRSIPPPEQKTETRGTNIKTGPFVRAERGKDELAENERGGDKGGLSGPEDLLSHKASMLGSIYSQDKGFSLHKVFCNVGLGCQSQQCLWLLYILCLLQPPAEVQVEAA